jgi:hypothetical protein
MAPLSASRQHRPPFSSGEEINSSASRRSVIIIAMLIPVNLPSACTLTSSVAGAMGTFSEEYLELEIGIPRTNIIFEMLIKVPYG